MAESPPQQRTVLSDVSNAVVKLHKEQFGRGPTNSRADYAGRDVLVCTLENALLPAERALIQMGRDQGVRDSRTQLQAATEQLFIDTIEELTGRKVRARECHRPQRRRGVRGLGLRAARRRGGLRRTRLSRLLRRRLIPGPPAG
jgi:uncharacterized protein YbcI